MKRIRLREYADKMTVTRQTAYNWYRKGMIPFPVYKVSERIIVVEVPDDFDGAPQVQKKPGKTVGYVRVSTNSQKDGLAYQKLEILEYANKNGITLDEVVEEVSSGFNDNRKKLLRILKDPEITCIIVEHRERLARSNFNLLRQTLAAQGREIVVLKTDDVDDDLVTEVTEFMVSAAGRIYGKRGAKRVKEQLEKESKEKSS